MSFSNALPFCEVFRNTDNFGVSCSRDDWADNVSAKELFSVHADYHGTNSENGSLVQCQMCKEWYHQEFMKV